MIEENELLKPIHIGNWHLRTKIVMAPMTRSFANNSTGTVGSDIAAYYRKRAKDGIGLIITEGINPSIRGKGTFGVPGLYSKDQIAAWRKVTESVHEEGGTIIAQLWDVGRLAHPDLTGGYPPLAPSAVKATGLVHRLRKPYETPVEMSLDDIKQAVTDYAAAAKNAMEAGFDGVEVHAAHGYLIDQFNWEVTNKRSDHYGGSLQNRLKFMKKVLEAVIHEAGADNTSVRFSELKDDMPDYRWPNPEMAIRSYLNVFREAGVKILHPSTKNFTEKIYEGQTLHELVRSHWDGTIIGVGSLDPETASQAIKKGAIDLAAFGRQLLANPDFVEKLKEGRALKPYDPETDLKHLV